MTSSKAEYNLRSLHSIFNTKWLYYFKYFTLYEKKNDSTPETFSLDHNTLLLNCKKQVYYLINTGYKDIKSSSLVNKNIEGQQKKKKLNMNINNKGERFSSDGDKNTSLFLHMLKKRY